jgi:CBS domain-containing protein
VAENTAVSNTDIQVNILDYGIPRRDRPTILKASYRQLFEGRIDVEGVNAKTAPLSSLKKTNEILGLLEDWIVKDKFQLTPAVQHIPTDVKFKPMKTRESIPLVEKVMTRKVITVDVDDSLEKASNLLIDNDVDQLPVTTSKKLVGIITSLDITKALAKKKKKLQQVMTQNVITSNPGETLDEVSRRLDNHGINSTPVVDESGVVVGIITLGDINRVYGRTAK